MKKKLICILVCMLMIITIIPSVSSINKVVFQKNNNISDDNTNVFFEDNNDIISRYTIMKDPIDFSNIVDTSPKPIPKSAPSEFSWKNYNGKDWTSPAKHQGPCGSCWAFAALGIYESMIKIREDCADFNPDLSEQYLLSCIQGAGSCRGGNTHWALELLKATTPAGNNCNGIIPESCLDYKADDDIPCSDKCENWEELLIPILDFGTFTVSGNKQDRDIIKTQIMETGPVVAYMKVKEVFTIWGALNHNPQYYFTYRLPVLGANHVIMIIGWKDLSSIKGGGYWICKNSWGQGWGYDGYFNIAYGSLNIDKLSITWADYDPDSFDWPPIADTGGPYGVYLGQQLTFDASESVGVEGEIVDYYWDFGDGANQYGITTTHTYTDLGVFNVILDVTDSENNQASGTTNVWIQDSNEPPNIPTINGPIKGRLGLYYEYEFLSTDPDGNDIWYIVDWDDGNIEEYGPYHSGEEASEIHYWDYSDSFTIKAKTKDVFGNESDWETFDITMPKSKENDRFVFINFINRIIEKFPLFAMFLQKLKMFNI